MKGSLEVIMNTALNPKSELKDFFSQNRLDNIPFFIDVFYRARFLQIFCMFHLYPPPAEQPMGVRPRGSKVKNTLDYINKKYSELFIPGVNVAIHELVSRAEYSVNVTIKRNLLNGDFEFTVYVTVKQDM